MGADDEYSQTTSRSDAVATALRNAIIEQALLPGMRLPEDKIGEQFGAGRTVVRNALTQLAIEGLVDMRRNRGAVVAEPGWDEARDTFDLRLALEELVVSRLVGMLDNEQIQTLRDHVAREDQARALGDEPKSIRLAGEFHTLLAEMTGSPILIRYMRELTSRCCLILALYSRPHSSECGVNEHRNLVDLLEAGDPACVEIMRSHITAVIDRALIQPKKRSPGSISEILAGYAAK